MSIELGRAASLGPIEQLAPAPLRAPGPYGLAYWQWLGLFAMLVVAAALGAVLGRLTRAALAKIARRTATGWDDEALLRLGAPIAVGWTLACARILLPWLELDDSAAGVAREAIKTALLLVVFWSLLRTVDVAASAASRSAWAQSYAGSRALVPLGARVLKVVIGALAAVALLAELGYPVASLVAGLGIGGVAIALAAQKTFENLFGAFTIGVDQPLREGDFVKIGDVIGTVEVIQIESDPPIRAGPPGVLLDRGVEFLCGSSGYDQRTVASRGQSAVVGAFQKLELHARGSGIDPRVHVSDGDKSPR